MFVDDLSNRDEDEEEPDMSNLRGSPVFKKMKSLGSLEGEADEKAETVDVCGRYERQRSSNPSRRYEEVINE